MNKKVKESINRIQEIVDFYKLNDENNYDYSDEVLISMRTLLDCITNLQKENEQLKKCNKESITFLNQDDIRDILIRKDSEIYYLQQKIDKSIKYIKKHKSTNPHLTSLLVNSEISELESILRGEE